MEVVEKIPALRERVRAAGADGVGLVPTMGNLHAGHLALVRACRAAVDVCVASIFVNPTQFGPAEDFASYPRTLAADLSALKTAGVDFVFAPTVAEMYPDGPGGPDGKNGHTTIAVPALAHTLCGASRPGHFDGVATVVAKLFHIVAPRQAFFGEKDWQQLVLVYTMARQLNMPVEVVGVPTVRAEDGLALSSRNDYLTAEERDRAPLLHRGLQRAQRAIAEGERDYPAIENSVREELAGAGYDVDYVAVRDAERLVTPDTATTHMRVFAAARLGRTRLIDNVAVAP